RDARAEAAIAVRVLQEVHDLRQLLLGLLDPGHVLEAHVLRGRLHPPRPAAAELAEHATTARRAGRAPGEPDEQQYQQDRGPEAEQQRLERRALAGRLRVDRDVLRLEQARELLPVGEDRNLGLEAGRRLV